MHFISSKIFTLSALLFVTFILSSCNSRRWVANPDEQTGWDNADLNAVTCTFSNYQDDSPESHFLSKKQAIWFLESLSHEPEKINIQKPSVPTGCAFRYLCRTYQLDGDGVSCRINGIKYWWSGPYFYALNDVQRKYHYNLSQALVLIDSFYSLSDYKGSGTTYFTHDKPIVLQPLDIPNNLLREVGVQDAEQYNAQCESMVAGQNIGFRYFVMMRVSGTEMPVSDKRLFSSIAGLVGVISEHKQWDENDMQLIDHLVEILALEFVRGYDEKIMINGINKEDAGFDLYARWTYNKLIIANKIGNP